ncbi:hypothetical protein [Streptomyces hydrogenans]|uniref:hypothetical protein n=1 Tax=Streptomyces hydrogenans TaxID=1873719 RepID=UPI0033AE6362
MNGFGSLGPHLLLLLTVGALVAYIAYMHPGARDPLLVASAVVTVLYLLMNLGGGDPPAP